MKNVEQCDIITGSLGGAFGIGEDPWGLFGYRAQAFALYAALPPSAQTVRQSGLSVLWLVGT